MFSFFGPNTLWALVYNSDLISKIVLLSLFILSICSWTVIVYTLGKLKALHKEIASALVKLQEVKTIDDLIVAHNFLKNSFTGDLFTHYFVQLKNLLAKHKNNHKESPVQALSPRDMERLQDTIDSVIDETLAHQSRNLAFLSITAAVAPLLGLLGTVWGLIHSFMDISAAGEADIATVAPGIAEALITTLAGMIVAIPALVMYHYLITRVRSLESLIRKASNHFESVVYTLVND